MTTCAKIIQQSEAAFGTSGVRGLVTELDDATCFAFTLAFLEHLKANKALQQGTRIWVGHDLRPSSTRITQASIAAIEHAGLSVVFCGEVPTPALAHIAFENNEPAIMITGSHIPFDRNGLKFYRADGEMMKEDEAPIINSDAEFPDELFEGKNLKTKRQININEAANEKWKERYLTTFPNLLTGLKICHYQHSAAGRDLIEQILTALGGEVFAFARSDEFIPIDTEAVSQLDKDQAIKWSNKYSFQLIISTDGDGDRPLLADENGNYFRGDTLGALAALYLKADVIATPVSSTTAIEKSNLFTKVHRTKIGSPHVIAAMKDASINPNLNVVGFEPNGGFLTASTIQSPMNGKPISPLPTRDALLPILATIALAKERGLLLSELGTLLPNRTTASDRLADTPKEISLSMISQFRENTSRAAILSPQNVAPTKIDETDGLRMTFPNGDIVHLRPSGNAPELRFYAESTSEDAAAKLQNHVRAVLLKMC